MESPPRAPFDYIEVSSGDEDSLLDDEETSQLTTTTPVPLVRQYGGFDNPQTKKRFRELLESTNNKEDDADEEAILLYRMNVNIFLAEKAVWLAYHSLIVKLFGLEMKSPPIALNNDTRTKEAMIKHFLVYLSDTRSSPTLPAPKLLLQSPECSAAQFAQFMDAIPQEQFDAICVSDPVEMSSREVVEVINTFPWHRKRVTLRLDLNFQTDCFEINKGFKEVFEKIYYMDRISIRCKNWGIGMEHSDHTDLVSRKSFFFLNVKEATSGPARLRRPFLYVLFMAAFKKFGWIDSIELLERNGAYDPSKHQALSLKPLPEGGYGLEIQTESMVVPPWEASAIDTLVTGASDTKLRTFSMAFLRVGPFFMERIGKLLDAQPFLESIDIHHCSMSTESLCSFLEQFKTRMNYLKYLKVNISSGHANDFVFQDFYDFALRTGVESLELYSGEHKFVWRRKIPGHRIEFGGGKIEHDNKRDEFVVVQVEGMHKEWKHATDKYLVDAYRKTVDAILLSGIIGSW